VGKELISMGVSNHCKNYNFTQSEHSEVNAMRKFVKGKQRRKHVMIINFCFVDGRIHKSEDCYWCGKMMNIYENWYKFRITHIIYYDGKQWIKKRKTTTNINYKTSGGK
jgi:hypothetical protein